MHILLHTFSNGDFGNKDYNYTGGTRENNCIECTV